MTEGPRELTHKKQIMRNGNALTIVITPEARELGLQRGDMVIVTIRRAED